MITNFSKNLNLMDNLLNESLINSNLGVFYFNKSVISMNNRSVSLSKIYLSKLDKSVKTDLLKECLGNNKSSVLWKAVNIIESFYFKTAFTNFNSFDNTALNMKPLLEFVKGGLEAVSNQLYNPLQKEVYEISYDLIREGMIDQIKDLLKGGTVSKTVLLKISEWIGASLKLFLQAIIWMGLEFSDILTSFLNTISGSSDLSKSQLVKGVFEKILNTYPVETLVKGFDKSNWEEAKTIANTIFTEISKLKPGNLQDWKPLLPSVIQKLPNQLSNTLNFLEGLVNVMKGLEKTKLPLTESEEISDNESTYVNYTGYQEYIKGSIQLSFLNNETIKTHLIKGLDDLIPLVYEKGLINSLIEYSKEKSITLPKDSISILKAIQMGDWDSFWKEITGQIAGITLLINQLNVKSFINWCSSKWKNLSSLVSDAMKLSKVTADKVLEVVKGLKNSKKLKQLLELLDNSYQKFLSKIDVSNTSESGVLENAHFLKTANLLKDFHDIILESKESTIVKKIDSFITVLYDEVLTTNAPLTEYQFNELIIDIIGKIEDSKRELPSKTTRAFKRNIREYIIPKYEANVTDMTSAYKFIGQNAADLLLYQAIHNEFCNTLSVNDINNVLRKHIKYTATDTQPIHTKQDKLNQLIKIYDKEMLKFLSATFLTTGTYTSIPTSKNVKIFTIFLQAVKIGSEIRFEISKSYAAATLRLWESYPKYTLDRDKADLVDHPVMQSYLNNTINRTINVTLSFVTDNPHSNFDNSPIFNDTKEVYNPNIKKVIDQNAEWDAFLTEISGIFKKVLIGGSILALILMPFFFWRSCDRIIPVSDTQTQTDVTQTSDTQQSQPPKIENGETEETINQAETGEESSEETSDELTEMPLDNIAIQRLTISQKENSQFEQGSVNISMEGSDYSFDFIQNDDMIEFWLKLIKSGNGQIGSKDSRKLKDGDIEWLAKRWTLTDFEKITINNKLYKVLFIVRNATDAGDLLGSDKIELSKSSIDSTTPVFDDKTGWMKIDKNCFMLIRKQF